MTAPLTDKAIAKIHALAEGNGLDPKKIELLGTEEKELMLKGEMRLSLDTTSTRQRYAGPPHKIDKNGQIVASVDDIAARTAAFKDKLLQSTEWSKEAVEQLKAAPGQGFGIEQAEITLDSLAQVFQATQNCDACHGAGTQTCEACKGRATAPCKICQATGQELCYHCQGSGKNPAAQPQSCTICHGRGTVAHVNVQNCNQCAGRGSVQRTVMQSCPTCHGRGSDAHDHTKSCYACHGRGQAQANVTQTCEICHGRGQVQTQQQQTCQICQGKGTVQPSVPTQCPICHGVMRILCRTCAGKKEVACDVCLGKGKLACKSCGAQGKFTVEEQVLPLARCEFRVLEVSDLPSGLRRALDRFGMKMLIKTGARITVGEAQEAPNKTASLSYEAHFPFADIRLRIGGKLMRAAVVGEKASIRDIPPFLDPIFAAALQKLAKQIGQRGLDKAFKLRAFGDLFRAMQEEGDAVLNFRKLYPVGFSAAMITRMQVLLGRLAEASTFTARAAAAGFLLLLLCGGYYALITSGVRAALGTAFFPAAAFILDGVACGISFLLVNIGLRFAALVHLKSLTRQKTRLSFRTQHAGSLGIGVGVCASFLYIGMLWFLKATP